MEKYSLWQILPTVQLQEYDKSISAYELTQYLTF